MTRALLAGLAALVFAAASTVAPGMNSALAQSGYDRPGGDYASAPVQSGDPAVCASRCEREKNCRAWSFSYPTPSGTAAMCFLKREVVPRTQSNCCVSGVRGAGVIEPRAGAIEYSIDRYRRRLQNLRDAAGPQGPGLRRCLPRREALPGLDLSPAGLRLARRALFPQGDDQAAAPSAVLYFGRGAVAHQVGAI